MEGDFADDFIAHGKLTTFDADDTTVVAMYEGDFVGGMPAKGRIDFIYLM